MEFKGTPLHAALNYKALTRHAHREFALKGTLFRPADSREQSQ